MVINRLIKKFGVKLLIPAMLLGLVVGCSNSNVNPEDKTKEPETKKDIIFEKTNDNRYQITKDRAIDIPKEAKMLFVEDDKIGYSLQLDYGTVEFTYILDKTTDTKEKCKAKIDDITSNIHYDRTDLQYKSIEGITLMKYEDDNKYGYYYINPQDTAYIVDNESNSEGVYGVIKELYTESYEFLESENIGLYCNITVKEWVYDDLYNDYNYYALMKNLYDEFANSGKDNIGNIDELKELAKLSEEYRVEDLEKKWDEMPDLDVFGPFKLSKHTIIRMETVLN